MANVCEWVRECGVCVVRCVYGYIAISQYHTHTNTKRRARALCVGIFPATLFVV